MPGVLCRGRDDACLLTELSGVLPAIAVDNRQSGPRPEPRLLHQAALEALTNSARIDTPRKTRPKTIFRRSGGGDGDGGRRTAAAARMM
ncbi:hypothetical protein F511_10215 [Dorcoceras hygrometricum]|uniref:Uncharacterized protein n=1 Tax=Dorcoceras hygrometricum TaxID=472368 RepID=A0A2Z7ARQ8_9LAMI|nr:hypothetical protein F511_10215 [Dorcoceras hygrometricum]